MMDSIDDERVIFYLKHQDLIETWAAVKGDVIREANRFYFSVADHLQERSIDLGDDVQVWVRDESWCNVGLYRREWFGDTGPLISACYEWSPRSTFRDGARAVGLRVHRKDSDDIRDIVADQVRGVRAKAGFPRSNKSWPAFRDAPTPVADEFWKDLSNYRDALVASVVEAWDAFSERASQAFEAWTQQNQRPR
jgi:hypothetical protein